VVLLQSLVSNSVVLCTLNLILSLIHFFSYVFSVLVLHINSVPVSLYVSDYINVSAVDVLEFALVRINTDSHGFKNTSDLNTVTGAHLIDHIIVSAQVNCLRGFTFRNTLWCLLYLNVLLVREHTVIMHQFKSVAFFAIFAFNGLINSTLIQKDSFLLLTICASEGSFFHFRNDITAADYNAA
jgi:hypothetical protein